jgi:prolyl oligopeptidase
MKKLIYLLTIMALLSCGKKAKFNYPETARTDVQDDYYGKSIPDPYRWLEDDNSAETKAWVIEQNKVTFDFLDKISFRERIRERYQEIWNYPKSSAPFKTGGKWFQYRNDGLENQSVLFHLENPEDDGMVFINPNLLSESGTISMTNFSVSDDGQWAGYGLSTGGSDWKEIKIREVGSGIDLPDHIKWVKFSGISWLDNGFFYSRYPEPTGGDELKGINKDSKIYYHRVGTEQQDDELIYEDTQNPDWSFGAFVTEDRKILVITASRSTSGNAFYVKDLTKKDSPVVKIVEDFEKDYSVIDHENGKLKVLTNFNAQNYRLIEIDLANPSSENWRDIIPEQKEVLSSVSTAGRKLIATFMYNAHDICRVYDFNGSYLYDIELPTLGSLGGFGGKKEDTFTFYTLSSFVSPATVYKYDIETNSSTLFIQSQIAFNVDDYMTRQVFYTSVDGTKVPMFIVHKKGIELDGSHPALLYGYGGFNVSLTPYFSIRNTVWLENGGIYAVANLRGGGEYGEWWHKSGTLMNKQNVFDDFVSAAKYLIENGFTNSGRLGIMGGSNGGLLVGAVANQHPELFKVALPAVGVMDMLRYHKFTIGRFWATDYGTAEDSQEMFEYLLGYSPLHNIRDNVNYPAVLVTTADHDDRVVPAHSFKYIATLQEKYKGDNPVMIRIETDAGHGAGTPTSKVIEEYADVISFLMYNVGLNPVYK